MRNHSISGLLEQFKQHESVDSDKISDLKRFAKVRHWLAHGRYFELVKSPTPNGTGKHEFQFETSTQAVYEFIDEWGIDHNLFEPIR